MICNKKFANKKSLRQHKNVHDKVNQCKTCQKCFGSKADLNLHIRTHTGEKPYQCKTCQKCFSCKSNLDRHIRTHTGEKPYVCSICDKKFAQKEHLKRHEATHSDERNFKCNICPDERSFKTKNELSQHMVFHYEPSYQCEVCPKSFHCKSTLNRHMRIHTGEKPYACSKCDKRFHRKENLKNHEATHSDEKNFKCDICPDERSFKTKHELSQHMVFHYEPKHSCPKCGKKFYTSSNMKRHFNRNIC